MFQEEYWIERKNHLGEWIPINKAYSHRQAKAAYDKAVVEANEIFLADNSIRVLKVTWEIIDMK